MTTKVVERTHPSPANISDECLIQQCLQGDPQAFDSLYDRYVKAVYKRVRYVIPEMDVEDVTQEVFLAMLTSISSFRGEAKFSTWLYTLTNNKVAEYHRRRSRKKETMQVDLVYAERRSDNSAANSLEDLITLQHALYKLPEQYREIILLRFAEDMRFNEIAALQGRGLEATKSLFRRAMSALQEILDVKNERNPKK